MGVPIRARRGTENAGGSVPETAHFPGRCLLGGHVPAPWAATLGNEAGPGGTAAGARSQPEPELD